jgi:hypothetical protein
MSEEKVRAGKQLKLKSSHITARQHQLTGYRTALKERQLKVQVLEEKIRTGSTSPFLAILQSHTVHSFVSDANDIEMVNMKWGPKSNASQIYSILYVEIVFVTKLHV